MLDEYMCFGGNEIANNARTYGYASTADCPLSWYRCLPCETLHDAVNDWTPSEYRWIELGRNLYTNPSFETTTGTIEVRRNLVPNPEVATATTLWGAGAANTGGVTTLSRITSTGPRVGVSVARKTWTTADSAAGTSATMDVSATSFADAWAVSASTQYTASIYVRSSNVENLRLDAGEYDASGASIANNTGTPGIMTAGQWSRISVTFTTGATTTKVRLTVRQVTSLAHIASSTWDATMALLETGATVLPYFSGISAPRLRENVAPNPRAVSTGSAWGTVAGGTNSWITDFSGDVSTAIRWTATASGAATRPVVISTGVDTPDLGDAAHIYLRLRVAGGTLSAVSIAVRPTVTSASNQTSVTLPDYPPGEYVIDVVTGATPASLVSGASSGIVLIGVPSVIGMTVDATAAVVEVGTTGGFFDGASVISGYSFAWVGSANTSGSYMMDADMTPSWTGTANASASIMSAPGITGQASITPAQVNRWSSVQDPYQGTRIARFQVQTASATAIPLGAGALVVGTQYTVIFRARANMRDTVVTPRIGAAQADNVTLVKGVWTTIRATLTATSTNPSQTGLLLSGAFSGHQVGDTIDIDTSLLAEGAFSGEYFDGSTPDQVHSPMITGDIVNDWLGTANGSVSIQSQYTVVSEGHSDEPPYESGNIERAPWYDADRAELTSRFYGTWLIEVTSVDDSTRTATVTESILDGGVVGLVRHASREMTVRALLSASGADALEYGLSWLDIALSADTCSSHGSACGAVDMTFFASCPDPEEPDDIVTVANEQIRYLHNVTVTSGPLIIERLRSNDGVHVAYIVEWTMVAGTPFVFGQTREVEIQPSVPVIIQDVPYNLIPVPSAELPGAIVTVGTNYITNPSVEVNATGWTGLSGTVSGTSPAAFVTAARDTTVHAGDGVASHRVRLLGNNGTTAVTNSVADISSQNETLITPATGQRYSVTVWGAVFIIAGAAGSAITSLTATIEWYNAAGTTLYRTDTLGTTTTVFNGRVFSAKSLIPPAGTGMVRTKVTARVTWSSSATAANNSDIQLFADTLAVTTP